MKKSIKRLISMSISILVLTLVMFTGTAEAKTITSPVPSQPVLFEKQIAVDGTSESFTVGFATVHFTRNFMNPSQLPPFFTAKIYAENGKVYIEFSPNAENFIKDVLIHADLYKGYIYDVTEGKNIYVEVKAQNFKVEHFSRYCFS